MADEKSLSDYLSLWRDFLRTGGNPPITITRMQEFVTFVQCAIAALMDANKLDNPANAADPKAQRLIADIGLFLARLGSYETWHRLDEKYRERIADLETQLEQRDAEAARRLSEIEQRDAQVEVLRRTNERLATEAADLRTQVGLLRSELEQAQAGVAKVREELGELAALRGMRSEMDAAAGRLVAAEAEAAQVRGQLTTLKGQLEFALRQVTQAQQAQTAAEAERDQLLAQLAALRERLAAVEQERDTLAATVADLRERLAKTEADLAKAQQETKDLRKRLSFVEAELVKHQELLKGSQSRSVAEQSALKSSVIARGDLEAAAQLVAKEWQVPAKLPVAEKFVAVGKLEETRTRLGTRLGNADAAERLAVLNQVEKLAAAVETATRRYTELTQRPDSKPLTAVELREAVELYGHLKAWDDPARLLAAMATAASR